MFVTTKTHHAVIREKDEVIEGLMRRLNNADSERQMWLRAHEKRMEEIYKYNEENKWLKNRLAPFERTRGKSGRFVKKGDVA